MRKRLFCVVGVLVYGCSFQLLGCNSQKVAEALASGITSTAVDVSAVIVESVTNRALGLDG